VTGSLLVSKTVIAHEGIIRQLWVAIKPLHVEPYLEFYIRPSSEPTAIGAEWRVPNRLPVVRVARIFPRATSAPGRLLPNRQPTLDVGVHLINHPHPSTTLTSG